MGVQKVPFLPGALHKDVGYDLIDHILKDGGLVRVGGPFHPKSHAIAGVADESSL